MEAKKEAKRGLQKQAKERELGRKSSKYEFKLSRRTYSK
jgi:hypothetical protein